MIVRSITPGNPVRVACDLSAAQLAASAHALHLHRDGRYRLAEMSVDDTLALRDLTGLVDRFDVLAGHGAHDTVQLTAAHLMQLSNVMRQFVEAQAETDVIHPQSRIHLAAAGALVDPLAELAREALQVALTDLPETDLDADDFDSLLGSS